MNEKTDSWLKDEPDSNNSELNQQELVEDLKNSLSSTIEDTADLLNNIIETIDESIMDDTIRIESKNTIKELRKDFLKTLNTTFKKISGSVADIESKDFNIGDFEEE
jgi:predicted transcriptional regulator